MINFLSITPHPPIIIPGVGADYDKKKVSKTIDAMIKLEESFYSKEIDTMIIISPHGPISYNEMTIGVSPSFSGNFKDFREYQIELNFRNDSEVATSIYEECEKKEIPINLEESSQLDHGCSVPLFFLTQNRNPKIVPVTYSFLNTETHFNFGKAIFEACKKEGKKIAVAASGDLSHRLTMDAPAGFSPEGKKFDKELIELLKEGNIEKILKMDKKLIKQAGECGYLSIIILLGVLSNMKKFKFEFLSYEGPLGVGYLVGNFLI